MKYKETTKSAEYMRFKRLKKRILFYLKSNKMILFLTMTFNNEILKNTNQQTRLRYIKQYLNEQANDYILNLDYGALNEREHYHALIIPKYDEGIYFKAYKYGQIKAEKVNHYRRFTRHNKTLDEIASDLAKHTTKDTTKNNKIIYSRRLRKNLTNRYKILINKTITQSAEKTTEKALKNKTSNN